MGESHAGASPSQATASQKLPAVRESHVETLCRLHEQAIDALNKGLARISGFEIDEEHGLGTVDRLGMTIEEQIAAGDPQGLVEAVRSAASSLGFLAYRMVIVRRFIERERLAIETQGSKR